MCTPTLLPAEHKVYCVPGGYCVYTNLTPQKTRYTVILEGIVCTPTLLPAEHKVYCVPGGYCVYSNLTSSRTQGILWSWRILCVLQHYSQQNIRYTVILENSVCTPTLLPAENKVYCVPGGYCVYTNLSSSRTQGILCSWRILCVHQPYFQQKTRYTVILEDIVCTPTLLPGTQGILCSWTTLCVLQRGHS